MVVVLPSILGVQLASLYKRKMLGISARLVRFGVLCTIIESDDGSRRLVALNPRGNQIISIQIIRNRFHYDLSKTGTYSFVRS